jgi:putative glutamine amidotransferase
VENIGSLDGLAGLFLAGGTDVDPALFGQERAAATDQPDTVRDALEAGLVKEALARDLPVFGICRGLQLLNVVLGGTLEQHIEGHQVRKQREVHAVRIAPGSRLERILGSGEYVVNSLHHQSAAGIAPSLEATAMAPLDGVVEALEHPGKRFVLAVQWHPEARIDGTDALLFEAFRDALNGAEPRSL